jgi:hypothetical protein
MGATSRQLHARVKPAGDRNVSLITQVRDGDRTEPENASNVTPNAVMKRAAQIAKEAGCSSVIWEIGS